MAESLGQPPPTYKPILGEWASNRPTRREEVGFARLRMVCTLPTHMLPYIANTFPPQCSICNGTLSVEHTLLHCVHYREERRLLAVYCRRGLSLTQTTLLGDRHPNVVDRLIYLTETNLIRFVIYVYVLCMMHYAHFSLEYMSVYKSMKVCMNSIHHDLM